MQLNSTNGSSAHDMVSLARQTESFPNPAGLISGAHLVKGQHKLSTERLGRGKIALETQLHSVVVVFSHSNSTLCLHKSVDG